MELQLRNISKCYGARQVLQPVDLTLNCGVYALLGPNGAGKTTLMNIITDLIPPTTGEVLFDGTEIHRLGTQYRKKLGYLPQNPGLYPEFTARELLEYFACLKQIVSPKQEIDSLLELVNLTEEKNKKIGTFSGGMKRRIGIAIALLGDPALLILDEPTTGLDPEERVRFRTLISKIGFSRTVIYATHIISDVVSIASQIILIQNGSMIKIAGRRELLDAVSGQVWEMTVPAQEIAHWSKRFHLTGLTPEGDRAVLRMLSPVCPDPSARQAIPNFEEVYLYWFRRQEEDHASSSPA